MSEYYAIICAIQCVLLLIAAVYLRISLIQKTKITNLLECYLWSEFIYALFVNLNILEIIEVAPDLLQLMETLARFTLWSAIFYFIAKRENRSNMLIYVSAFTITIISVWAKTEYLSIYSVIDQFLAGIEMIYGMIFFKMLIQELPVENPLNHYLFWFGSALFFRSGGIVWIESLNILYMRGIPTEFSEFKCSNCVVEYILLLLGFRKMNFKESNRSII